MVAIDPLDDGLHRFIVWHYRYDEDRRERRLIPVIAFSTQEEALNEFANRSAEVLRLQALGLVDCKEYLSCGSRIPGSRLLAVNDRISVNKMRSGWVAQGLTKKQTSGKPDWQSPS